MKIIINESQFKVLTEQYSEKTLNKLKQELSGLTWTDLVANNPLYRRYNHALKNGQIDDLNPNRVINTTKSKIDKLLIDISGLTYPQLVKNEPLYKKWHYYVNSGYLKDNYLNKDEDIKNYKISNLKQDLSGLTWEQLILNKPLLRRYKDALEKYDDDKFFDELFPNRNNSGTSGEQAIKSILTDMGFNFWFKPQKTFDDCRSTKINKRWTTYCSKLPFDFYIEKNNENNKKFKIITNKNIPNNGILIEYDGGGHFIPVSNWDFENTVRNDRTKNDYCKDNIKLIRISNNTKNYNDMKTQIENAFKSDKKLITTGNYPNMGWNSPDLPKPNFHSV